MKKKLLTYHLFAILLTGTTANAQIPNNGFENWANAPLQYQNPVNWNTNNSQPDGNHLVQISGIAHQGNSAVKVINYYNTIYQARSGGYTNTGFIYTQRPTALNGFYKAYIQNGDTATIEVVFKKSGNIIGSGIQYFTTNNSSYTAFSIPINFLNGLSPDSSYITISNGEPGLNFIPQVPDDSLIVDDLIFDLSSGINNSENEISFSISPNPVSEYLCINFPVSGKKIMIQVFNYAGQKLNEFITTTGENISVPVRNLKSGLYLVNIVDGDNIETRSFVKNEE